MLGLDRTNQQETNWIVSKFGGTSVGSGVNWRKILDIAKERLEGQTKVLIVCSAFSGVTDLMTQICKALGANEKIDALVNQLRRRHFKLSDSLELPGEEIWDEDFTRLKHLLNKAEDAILPSTIAEIHALGEIMSSRLGAAFLKREGLKTKWLPAWEMLTSEELPEASDERNYLRAECDFTPDRDLQSRLHQNEARVFVTQGYLAGNHDGEKVLLGRGGSDTSAAYFAAKLQAICLEIWTDVPGLFSANPKDVSTARLLRMVDYDEAETLANMGAKVLHPRCVAPLREARIPLFIKWTSNPRVPGTKVVPVTNYPKGVIKAVSIRKNLYVFSALAHERDSVGLLIARITDVLQKRGLDPESMSVVDRHVQVIIDPSDPPLTKEEVGQILDELSDFADSSVARGISVSLVGKGLSEDASTHLQAVMPLLTEQIQAIGQGGESLNFMLDPGTDDTSSVVRTLHEHLVDNHGGEEHFGPTWTDLKSARENVRNPEDEPAMAGAADRLK